MHVCRGQRILMNLPPSSSSSALFNRFPISTFSSFSRLRFSRGFQEWHSLRELSTGQRKNLYQVLGVVPTASQAEIKKAYYTLSKRYHPDVTGSNVSCAQKYIEVKEAYDILRDEQKRTEHDRWLAAEEFHRQQTAAGRHGAHPFEDQQQTHNDWINKRAPRGAFAEEELQRIWRNLHENAEFRQSHRDFEAAVRRRRQMAYEEQLRRRSAWANNGFNNKKRDWTDGDQTEVIGRIIFMYVMICLIITAARSLHRTAFPQTAIREEDYRRRMIDEMTRRMP
ncbi:DnaJ sub A member 3, mitochondrial [Globodera pallida]|nr:DnaJ sub A member 3, mitochondrial [Globodera pallida]